jgi:sulfur carrier protein ThiS adenylyltransferase
MTIDQISESLKSKTVGIAGCGGLGSNCAIALARSGIGSLVIADFDVISRSNLNRQYFFLNQVGEKKVQALKKNILRVNPEVRIVTHDIRITAMNIPSVYAGCDVIVEAFDFAGEKEMLIETILGVMPSVPLVVGLGLAGWGMNDSIHFRKVDNLYICGDETSEINTEQPPLAPRVGIVANMQANVVLEILLNSVIVK